MTYRPVPHQNQNQKPSELALEHTAADTLWLLAPSVAGHTGAWAAAHGAQIAVGSAQAAQADDQMRQGQHMEG